MMRLALAALLLLAAPAFAAQMEVLTLQNPLRRWLRIDGVILPGDERMFRDLVAGAPGATVILSGPGGSVAPALAIGREIQDRRLPTLVASDTSCASACSLIWLAGQRRLLGRGARIGFHALSMRRNDGARTRARPSSRHDGDHSQHERDRHALDGRHRAPRERRRDGGVSLSRAALPAPHAHHDAHAHD